MRLKQLKMIFKRLTNSYIETISEKVKIKEKDFTNIITHFKNEQ